MAYSVVDTHIQNPARRGHNVAKSRRKMSAKQIKHFGTKRQKAALRAKRHTRAGIKSSANGVAQKSEAASEFLAANDFAFRAGSHRSRPRRKNPELVSFLLGNPAKRRIQAWQRIAERSTQKALRCLPP